MITYGNQDPTIMSVPTYSDTSGMEAIELAEYAGMKLDPWQKLILREGLGEKEDGRWSAFEVSTVVSRQNGKGEIIVARQLAGLFLFGEQLMIHTAHEVKTAKEAFTRVVSYIDNCDDLRRKVKKVVHGKGDEGIELLNGARLKFLSRTHSSGRGFSCDCVILDESMILGADSMAALLPTLSARQNPQVWYFGSAGIGDKSTQLALLRNRALQGGDDSLAYFEWGVEVHNEMCLPSCDQHYSVRDEEAWLLANPGIGYRPLDIPYCARELRALGPAMFARERLGVGEYPDAELGDSPISIEEWNALTNVDSKAGPDVVFAVDVPPDRSSAVIAAFSVDESGYGHVELVDRRPGTDWVADRLVELKEAWNPVALAMDSKGPAAALLMAMEVAEIEEPEDTENPDRGDLFLLSVTDMQAACGQLVDAVRQDTFRHLGDEVLAAAVVGACTRPIADAWVWTRRKSTMDVSPLVAVTMARYVYMAWYELVVDYDILSSAW